MRLWGKTLIFRNRDIQTIIGQSFYQILGKFSTAISTIIVLAIISTNYQSEGVGVYTLALAYLGFFYLAADLGLNAFILPKLSLNSKEADYLFTLRLIIAIGLVLVSIILAHLLPIKSPLFVQAVYLGAISIIFNGIFNSANLIFQKNLRYDLSVIGSILGALVTVLLIYYLSNIRATIPYLILAPTIGWLINILVAGILVGKFHRFKILPIAGEYLSELIKKAWPVALTLLLNVLYFRIDTFILGSFHQISIVGQYNLAYQFFQTALVLPTFIMNSYYPIMLKKLTQSKEIFYKELKIGTILLLVVGGTGTMLTFLLSPILIKSLSGEDGSIVSLNILSLGFPAFFASAILMWALISLKKFKTVLTIYAVGFLVNLTLNFLLIPTYAYIGASVVTVLSEYLILGLLTFILIKEI